jgi:hypothetical protein
MNDPKEIAINVVADWYASPAMCNEAVTDNALDSLRDTIAAAIQAEREDGCRRVNETRTHIQTTPRLERDLDGAAPPAPSWRK